MREKREARNRVDSTRRKMEISRASGSARILPTTKEIKMGNREHASASFESLEKILNLGREDPRLSARDNGPDVDHCSR